MLILSKIRCISLKMLTWLSDRYLSNALLSRTNKKGFKALKYYESYKHFVEGEAGASDSTKRLMFQEHECSRAGRRLGLAAGCSLRTYLRFKDDWGRM